MKSVKENIEAILDKKGQNLKQFLAFYNVEKVEDLTLSMLDEFCQKENIQIDNLLKYNLFLSKEKLKSIKLLILDVDGVMTDGGMYFTEAGDQFKKYNAKDGMAILNLNKYGIEAGIISSGFKSEMVKSRAELLQIERFYVGRQPKIEILMKWCDEMDINLDEVAIIGDDINDLSIIRKVGISACPSDAIDRVKQEVDLVLQTAGGKGCVREFIDCYLLEEPMNK